MEEKKATAPTELKPLSELSYEELSRVVYLFIEPFYGGSHKQLIDLLAKDLFAGEACLLTLPDKKWQWYCLTP